MRTYTHISGQEKVELNLKLAHSATLALVAEEVEKTCVDIANHAQAGHEDPEAHAMGRYRNQTTTLTRSITPELVKADSKSVEGNVYTAIEYAMVVEDRFPFMLPALIANNENFKKKLKVITGASG